MILKYLDEYIDYLLTELSDPYLARIKLREIAKFCYSAKDGEKFIIDLYNSQFEKFDDPDIKEKLEFDRNFYEHLIDNPEEFI